MSSNPHDQSVLAAIGPLREAGFALHWLHPRAKRPIGNDWSERPVASLDSLRASHASGNNVGVRLGEPFLTNAGHGHVIDMDIRIADCAEEAWEALAQLLPGIDLKVLPSVQSGSGGESRHLYFVTDKPFFGKKLAVSEGKHRRFDHDRKKEVWSYDWEIELFGTGKQVAMPPSIHPDTGKPYIWERPFDLEALAFGDGPRIPAAIIEALGAAETSTYEFESREPLTFKPGQMERDLEALPAERIDDYHDWVTLGQALHHQFGASDSGFDLWVEQSKRSEKFDGSKAGLREMRKKWRGFGRNRRQPVTMATVRQWAADARAENLRDQFGDLDEDSFDADAGPVPSASPAADARSDFDDDDAGGESSDFDALGGDDTDDDDDLASLDLTPEEKAEAAKLSWVSLLHITDEGAIKPTLHNLELILKNDPRLAGLAQINEFTQETVQRTPPGTKAKRRKNAAKDTRQLTGRVWDVVDTLNGELWSDDRDFAIRSIIEAPETQGGYGIKVSDRDLKAAIVLAANDYSFHPVREYLESTAWDGVPRCEQLFQTYVNAPDDAYHRSVSRLVLIAAVTRIFEPGHKFDFATILEGLQGKRKSTFIQILGRRWFAELDGDFHDSKQMVELMQGAWIMEIPELTGFGRADVRAIKAFISRQRDRARLAYARRAGEFPRQCVFIGSTNDREYLKDDTGGRRFWPVECRLGDDDEIDTDALEANVDQIWAEAVVLYREMRTAKPRGTLPLYLADAEAKVQAARLQESRRVESPDDVLAGRIAEWLDKPITTGSFDEDQASGGIRNETCSAQIWVECLGGDPRAFKAAEQAMVNRAMLRVPGWGSDGTQHRFPGYGKQRVFYRGGEAGKLSRMGIGLV